MLFRPKPADPWARRRLQECDVGKSAVLLQLDPNDPVEPHSVDHFRDEAFLVTNLNTQRQHRVSMSQYAVVEVGVEAEQEQVDH